jgi:hypothetical protein
VAYEGGLFEWLGLIEYNSGLPSDDDTSNIDHSAANKLLTQRQAEQAQRTTMFDNRKESKRAEEETSPPSQQSTPDNEHSSWMKLLLNKNWVKSVSSKTKIDAAHEEVDNKFPQVKRRIQTRMIDNTHSKLSPEVSASAYIPMKLSEVWSGEKPSKGVEQAVVPFNEIANKQVCSFFLFVLCVT